MGPWLALRFLFWLLASLKICASIAAKHPSVIFTHFTKRMMEKNRKIVITISTREATLKKRLRSHLRLLGFTKNDDGILTPPGSGKDVIRTIHSVQRDDRLAVNQHFLAERFSQLIKHFASGKEVEPTRITRVLQRVTSGTWESDLFRMAGLTWSVPVSNGFGRRLRYLVWDDHNGKLIGIVAIGDPVFNLSVRDRLIDWNVQARSDRLVNIMDAYVLGALPPYNALLGGKLVACLIRTRDIYNDFARAYGKTAGIISHRESAIYRELRLALEPEDLRRF